MKERIPLSPSGFFTGESRKMRFTGAGGGVGGGGGPLQTTEGRKSILQRIKFVIQERQRYPEPIEPAKGEERQRLLTECREILTGPDFDGAKFLQWVSVMIRLTGGSKVSATSEEGSSFHDPQTGYVIAIDRTTKEPYDLGSIAIKRLIHPNIHLNILLEGLTYGERRTGKTDSPTPQMYCFLKKKEQNPTVTFDSFILREPVTHLTSEGGSMHLTGLTPQIAKQTCQRVSAAYEEYEKFDRMFPRVRSTTRMEFEKSEEYRRGSHGIR